MSEMRTEEEQVQAIKEWWKENGKSLLIGVGAAVAIVVGWKAWQQNEQRQAETASALYQNLVDAVLEISQKESDDASRSTALHLGNQLKDEFAGESYARLAALLMARVAVDSGDLSLAVAELDWVLANQPTESQKSVALIRKARLLAAQNDVDQALALLGQISSAAFKAQSEEVRGDLFVMKNELVSARQAYQAAITAAGASNNSALLQIKLDNLAGKE